LGETFRIDNRALATGARSVPIYLAASRPRMLELAGALADGVLISGGSSVEFVRWCMDHVRRGAGTRTVRATGLVYGAVARDPALTTRLRRLLAMLLRNRHHRTNMELAGTEIDQERLRADIDLGDWPRVEAQVTDAVLHKHTAVGSAAQVRARIAAYYEAGLHEVVFAATRDGAQITDLLAAVA
jgi:5,10-methylenetetrahydromethanopterin reductase